MPQERKGVWRDHYGFFSADADAKFWQKEYWIPINQLCCHWVEFSMHEMQSAQHAQHANGNTEILKNFLNIAKTFLFSCGDVWDVSDVLYLTKV